MAKAPQAEQVVPMEAVDRLAAAAAAAAHLHHIMAATVGAHL
jgi:hypothetical protein